MFFLMFETWVELNGFDGDMLEIVFNVEHLG